MLYISHFHHGLDTQDYRASSLDNTAATGTITVVKEHAKIKNKLSSFVCPRGGSGVIRRDPLRFLAGCRKRRLNQALSILS